MGTWGQPFTSSVELGTWKRIPKLSQTLPTAILPTLRQGSFQKAGEDRRQLRWGQGGQGWLPLWPASWQGLWTLEADGSMAYPWTRWKKQKSARPRGPKVPLWPEAVLLPCSLWRRMLCKLILHLTALPMRIAPGKSKKEAIENAYWTQFKSDKTDRSPLKQVVTEISLVSKLRFLSQKQI